MLYRSGGAIPSHRLWIPRGHAQLLLVHSRKTRSVRCSVAHAGRDGVVPVNFGVANRSSSVSSPSCAATVAGIAMIKPAATHVRQRETCAMCSRCKCLEVIPKSVRSKITGPTRRWPANWLLASAAFKAQNQRGIGHSLELASPHPDSDLTSTSPVRTAVNFMCRQV